MVIIRQSASLSPLESAFLRRRRQKTVAAFEALFNEKVDARDVPVVAVAASGGGSRAMISTLASLNAMHGSGLLDTVSYVAGVSGSTWSMAYFYNYQTRSIHEALAAARRTLTRRVLLSPKIMSLSLDSLPKSAMATATERWNTITSNQSKQKLSLADVFGVILTAACLEGPGTVNGDGKVARISNQASRVDQGDVPLPLYTAVTYSGSGGREKYQWLEFSPYEMGFISSRNEEVGAWIPMSSFGQTFANGMPVSKDPEVPFGILLGVFGSAFAANLHRILQELNQTLPDELLESLSHLVFNATSSITKLAPPSTGIPLATQLQTLLSPSKLALAHPISPSSFPNPVYNLDTFADRDIASRVSLPLMDGGMDCSIPIAAALHPSRHVDVVIVLDSGSDIGSHPFVARMDEYARNRNIALGLPELNPAHRHVPLETVQMLKDVQKGYMRGVDVVYLPLVGEAAIAWYSKAANFLWTKGQVDAVSHLAALQVWETGSDVSKLLKKVWMEKRRRREGQQSIS